jgi:CelD/BcsL family acetyltransferase involved in cellulose biosynthesis
MLTPTPIDDARWAAFIASSGDATPFHGASWVSVVADCYGFSSFALTLERDGEIVAGLPVIELGRGRRRRWLSLPFTDRCGPLLAPGVVEGDFATTLEQTWRNEGVSRLELRCGLPTGFGYAVPCGYWHELELESDGEVIRGRFHQLRRRLLARADAEGVVSRTSAERGDLCEVFFGLHVATRKRLGVPVQPRRFFDLLWERMIAPGNGFVQLAYLGDVPIAAGVFLTSGSRVTTKFTARNDDYARAGGVDAMYWGAMQWGVENGRRVFDFGRTEIGNEGLRQFKLSWGSSEDQLAYTVFGLRAPSREGGRSAAALGTVLRRSPKWVSRAVGYAAYRYVA